MACHSFPMRYSHCRRLQKRRKPGEARTSPYSDFRLHVCSGCTCRLPPLLLMNTKGFTLLQEMQLPELEVAIVLVFCSAIMILLPRNQCWASNKVSMWPTCCSRPSVRSCASTCFWHQSGRRHLLQPVIPSTWDTASRFRPRFAYC